MIGIENSAKVYNMTNTIRAIPKPFKLNTCFNYKTKSKRNLFFAIDSLSRFFSLSTIPKKTFLPLNNPRNSLKVNLTSKRLSILKEKQRSQSLRVISPQELIIRSRNAKALNTMRVTYKHSSSSKGVFLGSESARTHCTPLMQKYIFIGKREKELRRNASNLEVKNYTLNKLTSEYNFFKLKLDKKVFLNREIFDFKHTTLFRKKTTEGALEKYKRKYIE